MNDLGPFSVPCQRCGLRASVNKRIENTRTAWLFCAATNRSADEVRLCSGCIKTVDSLGLSIAKAKKREKRTRRIVGIVSEVTP